MLSQEEVAGVMAHELGHVRNRDTLIMTMVATIAGAISMLANFGLFFRGHDGRGAGMAGLLAILVAPFAAIIVQIERKSVVSGQSVSVRVVLGGRRCT